MSIERSDDRTPESRDAWRERHGPELFELEPRFGAQGLDIV